MNRIRCVGACLLLWAPLPDAGQKALRELGLD